MILFLLAPVKARLRSLVKEVTVVIASRFAVAVVALGIVSLSSVACAPQVSVSDDGGPRTSTGTEPISPSSAASTGASTSASTGGTGGESPGVCVPKDPPTDFEQPTCADLSGLTVATETPAFVDDSGDGVVSPGEGATLSIALVETAGTGFSYYPGVVLESSNPDVKVSDGNWFYAIGACQVETMPTHIDVGANVAPGTVVQITARVGMISGPCPDTHAVTIPIVIQ